jgi:multicomponent Na+:H+ antiporter subunit E
VNAPAPGELARTAAVRGAGLLAFWVVLIGGGPGDLVAGLLTAGAATWVSIRLLPAGNVRLYPVALGVLALRFGWQSVVAGWDVARRAFDPRLPMRPGFASYPVRLPPGPARNIFTMITSLLPGTVPAGDDGDAVLYHCLDTEQPVLSQLAAEETVLTPVLGGAMLDD